MSHSKSNVPITRRTALALGGGTAAGLLLPSGLAQAAAKQGGPLRQSGRLPSLAAMEKILHAEGDMSEGLAHFSIDRDDAKHVKVRWGWSSRARSRSTAISTSSHCGGAGSPS
jgi:hypothetical protein